IIALVEQPMAMATVMAFSNEARDSILAGVRSSQTMSTARRPHSVAMRIWLESTAGMDEAPGSVKPQASAIPVIVLAVPMAVSYTHLRAHETDSSLVCR